MGFVDFYFLRDALVGDHYQYFSIIGVIALVIGSGIHVLEVSPRNAATLGRLALAAVATVLVPLFPIPPNLSIPAVFLFHSSTSRWTNATSTDAI
jgi:hypothetical protein